MQQPFGIVCFVMAIINAIGAFYLGLKGVPLSLVFSLNFLVFGSMLMLRVFG